MTAANIETRFPPAALVLIAVLLWSTGGLFIKLTTLDAYQVTFFRSLLAGITVAILTRKQGLRIDAFGVLTSVIYAVLLFLFVWATKHTTAANAIFLQYTAPIYILILAPFVIGEKFHWRDLVTVVFCIGGMSLFFVGKLEITDYQGNIAALFSGVFLGLYIMLLKHPRATGRREIGDGSQESEPRAVATGSPLTDERSYRAKTKNQRPKTKDKGQRTKDQSSNSSNLRQLPPRVPHYSLGNRRDPGHEPHSISVPSHSSASSRSASPTSSSSKASPAAHAPSTPASSASSNRY